MKKKAALMGWLLLGGLAIFSCNPASTKISQPPPTPDLSVPIPLDPRVRVGVLENGLTYYIQKNKKPENRAEFRLVVNAGSLLEEDDQQGLAHFVEHMGFNGSKHFKKNDLVDFFGCNK